MVGGGDVWLGGSVEMWLLVVGLQSCAASDQRFLRCPAAVTIAHLKKYVKLKFALDHQLEVRRS